MDNITLKVNNETHHLEIEPETPLLFVLRNELGLKGPKLGCAQEQCGACKVLVDRVAVPSCQLPVKRVEGLEVTTLEGLGSPDELHPLQEAFIEMQAGQCGYCTAGMIIAAQGLLNRVRYPTDEDIDTAFADNLCRCGVYDRVRRAIKLRIGRLEWDDSQYTVLRQNAMNIHEMLADLSPSLAQAPELDSWIRINADGTIIVFSGKVELGQGLKTSLAQIVAEELDVALARVQVMTADTHNSPGEGLTAGSMSIEVSGSALRLASAQARYVLLTLAFEELEAKSDLTELVVVDGTITDPATGNSTDYWSLMGGKPFNRQIAGVSKPKHYSDYRLIGQSEKRVDLLNKVTGGVNYVHDMDLPHMLHARVVRPPNYHARLVSLNTDAVENMAGIVKVMRDGSFVAVVAENEYQAVLGADALRNACVWENKTPLLSDIEGVYEHLVMQSTGAIHIVDGVPTEGAIPPIITLPEASQSLTATYHRPYHMHGSIGPSASVAQWDGQQMTIWSHTQGAFLLQGAIADVLNLDTPQVRVIHTEGAGCYGHNGADDVALDAALVARAIPNRPIMLKWSRADEHGWEPYGSAMVMQMNADIDSDGQIIAWNHDVWSYTHSTRPRPMPDHSLLLGAWHLEKPIPAPTPTFVKGAEFGGHRNAEPIYVFPHKRVVRHFTPDSPLRVSAMRGLGAYANVFAIESFMDELALQAGIDPIEFRLRHLADERGKAVIEAVAKATHWQKRTGTSMNGKGRGFAFARYKNKQCYVAMVVDLEVNTESGEIQLKNVVLAADTGQIVNPDGLSNQLEGGFVQAASWTLYEQVVFNEDGITSLDWDTYPILHMKNAPAIQTILLDRPDQSFLGAGEASQNPTPAAIANAIYDAVGLRLREIPFTPKRIRMGLKN